MPSTRQKPILDSSKYLGRPWRVGEYDCWSLVREVYLDAFGIMLPTVPVLADDVRAVLEEFGTSPLRGLFQPLVAPEHCCVVEITEGTRANHCGIYLDTDDGARILHNHRASGVVCEPMTTLRCRKMAFYRYG